MQIYRSILAVFMSLTLSAHGQIAKEEAAKRVTAPPQAVPVSIQVQRGGKVEIPLRIYGTQNQPIKFRIRSLPEFGKLSEIKMTGRETAAVTYEHSGSVPPRRDKFSYAAQTNVGVSASSDVNIAIVDVETVLAVPQTLDFGRSTVGSSTTKEITIENRGGSMIDGRVEIDEPWKIEGKDTYSLRKGDKAHFNIVFIPQTDKGFQGYIRYSTHPDRLTILSAIAEAPFEIKPARLDLTAPVDETRRSGVLEISNRTKQNQTLHITSGKKLETPEQLEIPAGETVLVTVKSFADDLKAFDDEIVIRSENFNATIPVSASGVGPIIRADPDVLFEKVNLNREGRKPAILKINNVGGARALVTAEVPAPFEISAADSSFTLETGGEKEIQISIKPKISGTFKVGLKIKSNGKELEIPVQAEVTGKPRSTAIASLTGTQDSQTPKDSLPSEPDFLPELTIDPIEIKNIRSTRFDLEWSQPWVEEVKYTVESRAISMDTDGGVKTDWFPLPNVTIKQSGRKIQASLGNFKPESFYFIRVSFINPDLGKPESSFPIQFKTTKNKFRITPLDILILMLIVLVFFIVRQRNRANS